MRKWTMYVSVAVALCFVAGTLLAAEPGATLEKPRPLMANGVVKSYTPDTKVLVVTVKKETETTDMSFQIVTEGDGATKITVGKETKGVDALTEGAKVHVAYKKGEGDAKIAVVVRIAGAEKPKGTM